MSLRTCDFVTHILIAVVEVLVTAIDYNFIVLPIYFILPCFCVTVPLVFSWQYYVAPLCHGRTEIEVRACCLMIMNDIMHCYCVKKFVSTLDVLLHCVQQWLGCKGQYDFH